MSEVKVDTADLSLPKKSNFSRVNRKAWVIAKKNFKEKMKNWQSMIWTIGFPIMMLIVYNFIFSQEGEEPEDAYLANNLSTFDIEFPGIVVYSVGMVLISSAIMFAAAKKSGTLERMDTMPAGRANIFMGAIISETFFMIFQISVIFSFGYGILGAYFKSWGALLIGFFIALIFGIGCIGIGLLISGLANSAESANGFGMLVHWPLLFLSGSFFPFESNVVYATPYYWIKQVYLQITIFGDGLSDKLYSSSLIGYTAEEISITILGGIAIIVGFMVVFISLGIFTFQKKSEI